MNIFGRLKSVVAKTFTMIFGGNSSSWWVPRTNYNYYAEVGDFTGSSVVMAPVLWIMRVAPEAPLKIELDGEFVKQHDLLSLIHRPNPHYSYSKLLSATMISLALDGNGYWLKIRNSQYKPVELWYVPHWTMTPKWDTDGKEYITYYEYSPNGRAIKIDPDDVVHFRNGLDPANTRKGLSPLKSLIREVFTDDEAANFSASILRNHGVIGVIVSPEGQLTANPKDVEDIKKYIDTGYRGDNRGRPLVLSRATKVQQFGFNPNEMDVSKLRNISEERVTACLGIPAAVVGLGTGLQQTKVGATMKEMRALAYENCIIPMQRSIAEELEIQLLPDFEEKPDKFDVNFDYSNVRVLQEDQDKLYERYNTGVGGGWLKVSDVRNKLGWESVPADEIYLRKINVVEIAAGNIQAKMKSKSRTKDKVPEIIGRLIKLFNLSLEKLQTIFEPELTQRFISLGKKVAKLYIEEATKLGIKTKQKPPDTNYPTDMVLVQNVGLMLQTDVLKSDILGYQPFYLRVSAQTIDDINTIFNLGVNMVDIGESAVMDAAGKRMGLIDLTEQSKTAMFDAIKEGRALGEGIPQIAKRIEEHVSAGPWTTAKIRSQVIARTEAKYAQNVSSLEIYRKLDTVRSIMIIDGQSSNSDEYCIGLDGTTVSKADASYYAAEEHPNGTRSFAPIFGIPEGG